MATRIIEYGSLSGAFENMPVVPGNKKILAQPAITANSGAQASDAFSSCTHLICVDSDEKVHVDFGADPEASTDDETVKAGVEKYFAVSPGSKVSVLAAA